MQVLEKENQQEEIKKTKQFRTIYYLGIIFGVFALMVNCLPFEANTNKGLAILFLASSLWLTEIVNLSVTALIIPVAAVYLNVLDTKTAMNNFSHPIIYLFLGGFILASAINNQELDKYFAKKLITKVGNNFGIAIIILFFITALLSMWINNISTTLIMLPLALSLLKQLDKKNNEGTYIFSLLGIAYSANIGGIGTIVGSAPNAIAASYVGIDFLEWMKFGIPTVLLMMPLMIGCLYFSLKPNLKFQCNIDDNIKKITNDGKITLFIFIATAFLWINSKYVASFFGNIKYMDSIISLTAAITLISLNLVDWKKVQQDAEWGVLILFGGGLTLNSILKTTGTSDFIGNIISQSLGGTSYLSFIAFSIISIITLTQFTSNTASAALLIPLFTAIAESMNIPTSVIAALLGMAASFAFLLPVATPPNAIVYGTGHIKQSQMIRTGFLVNICSIAMLFVLAKILI